ncbi:MAG: XRE family transcriptional regulator, partial [Butyrivibrio hungatei]|nr:XRE family transcriptional regulator [Butyrivibrio hungatei]
RSSLERSYYYQIMKGTRSPGRDKVLRLCLAAELTLRQTTRALELSGNAPLYPKNRRDIILTVAINQKAGVIDANLLLSKYGEEPLA